MLKDALVNLKDKLFNVKAIPTTMDNLQADLSPSVPPAEIVKKDCQINVYNFKKLQAQSPSEFGFIRFDPNNNCNLHCVYCHNQQTNDIVDTEELRAFLENNVISTDNFQVGCIMEPTMDSRICDLMLMVAHSPAKPKEMFMLQTNGILLHKHDYGKMREAGLTHLSVSIDAAEPETQKILRSGTSLNRVISNVKSFRQACPEIKVIFITTVTSANVKKMENLVALGLDVGVSSFVVREVFYHPDNEVVDREKMPALLLKGNDFSLMKQSLIEKFGTQADFLFADQQTLDSSTQKMKSDSGLETP